MSVSKSTKKRVYGALTEDYSATDLFISRKLRISRGDVIHALRELKEEGRAKSRSTNKVTKWKRVPAIAHPRKAIVFEQPDNTHSAILRAGSNLDIIHKQLGRFAEFTQTAQSLATRLPQIAQISSSLAQLRTKGLVESQKNGSYLYWKVHPVNKPLMPPQPAFKPTPRIKEHKPKAKPMSDEKSNIDVIIDRILDDMVELQTAVKDMQENAPSGKTLELIQQLAQQELNKTGG